MAVLLLRPQHPDGPLAFQVGGSIFTDQAVTARWFPCFQRRDSVVQADRLPRRADSRCVV